MFAELLCLILVNGTFSNNDGLILKTFDNFWQNPKGLTWSWTLSDQKNRVSFWDCAFFFCIFYHKLCSSFGLKPRFIPTDRTFGQDVQFYIILEIQSITHTYRMLWHHWLRDGFLKRCKLGKFEKKMKIFNVSNKGHFI